MMELLTPINNKIYATAEAFIVSGPVDMPRELAAELDTKGLNQSYLWVAGRYVQANRANKNGHYWTFDDLQKGQQSIQYVPVNALHKWDTAIGTIVQSKIVHREEKVVGEGEKAADRLIPEIQVLGLVWAANFPEVADKVRESNEKKQLWWSMECVAESTQCLTCDEVFPYAMAAAQTCVHMASSGVAPRRFINPTFLGGALIFPPERPAWPDAEAELARELVSYASRDSYPYTSNDWEQLMLKVLDG
jgi:hypothetical protein